MIAAACILEFGRRAWFGVGALGFGDETMHLLGGWALDSGERLYRDFVDLHGPGIFLVSQAYGALFGWSHANGARLVIAGLAVLAGVAVATSPMVRGPARLWAAALYFGLLATVWLVQGLYLFSYYPLSGALAVIQLAWFTLPAAARAGIPAWAAAVAGAAGACLAFTSYSEAPSAVLFSAAGCLAAWRGGQRRAARAHLAGAGTAGVMLFAWLVIYGDVVGALAFHVAFGLTVFPRVAPLTLGGLVVSLTPSLAPGRLVESAAVLFVLSGAVAALAMALRPGRRRREAVICVALAVAGLVLLNIRGVEIFQDGAFLFAAIGWFALAAAASVRVRPGGMGEVLAGLACIGVIAMTEGVLRQAPFTPASMTRAQFLGLPPAPIGARAEGPMFDAIRRLTRPDERILALVYRPQTYFAAGRLPINRLWEYLPTDAIYAKAPQLGETRDLCAILAASPPPVIVFDNWAVWGIYRPADYMPCLFKILSADYKYIAEPGDAGAEAPKLYVRNDRVK